MVETSVRLLRLLTLLQARREWSGSELAEWLAVTHPHGPHGHGAAALRLRRS
ncbi:hypothetical protein [Micromonospora sp. NPDC050276]|uniref:hypothetical protein n=1 Tax=Micromonospora sp. NPDC050276 TaxID=3364278 RepID=UPI0037AA0645